MKQQMLMVLGVLMAMMLSACSVVDTGERGVRVSMGKASDEVVMPGPNLVFPFVSHIRKIPIQIQRTDVEGNAASRDMQEVRTEVAVNWHIEESKVVEIVKTIGDEEELLRRIIVPAVNEVLKEATAKKPVEEVLTKRAELKNEIDKALASRLKKYGVLVTDVSIVNIHFSPEFTKSIEQKQIAEQKAKQAEYEALKAEKDAMAVVNKAKGDAEAQKLLKATITEEVLRLKAIEAWNGALPQVIGGNGVMPMLNIKASELTGRSGN